MIGCGGDFQWVGLAVKFILVVLTLAGSVSAAVAADVLPPAPAAPPVYRPPPASPAYNWSGFYIGAMGGYGWSSNSGNDLKGGFVGGTIGGNAQFGNFVVGGELEGAWADINQSATLLGIATAKDTIQGFGSATARVGVAVDNLLIYGKGGFAAMSNNIKVNVLGLPLSDTQTHVGYTVGGGLEYGFTPNWSVKGEYLFAHYDSKNYFNSGLLAPGFPSGTLEVHTVKLGFNYRFGWGGPVVARY
jgi:outer membrane immunogenic protein